MEQEETNKKLKKYLMVARNALQEKVVSFPRSRNYLIYIRGPQNKKMGRT
jgi:hypothetical protein